ncbi:hypothetical protein SUGI_0028480 [Cryptomeria japonica]|uniref:ankyrin repeat-containing protein NPR4 isoform X2 n=1 Tax=Cryptomeria japonica TaxID=3369 RepID=UPI002408EC98|nr:ankyrin repeat-containing protein NPR4 isoform X2 [Cryptomeria japonica]GLJ05932.1 hypothetical protein SUGI_0028480 [Cryptomeria japonica]
MDNRSNETSFFVACHNGDIRTAKDLLKFVHPSSLLMTLDGRTCFHVAVIAGDSDLIKTLRKPDKKGDTALHLAVRKQNVDLVKQLVDLDASSCECANKEGETPLKLAVSLGFKEAAELLITHTPNALHYVVKLNQVRLIQFFIEEKINMSKVINQHYQPSPSPLTNTQPSNEAEQHPKEERSLTKANTQNDQPTVQLGDTPLHIAARNKFEHMVNLLLKVPGVDKLALNSEDKTPFEIAREVVEYHEPFRIIGKLAYYRGKPKPFMYCAPQVSHTKLMKAREMVTDAYEARRNAELVVAALLAAMTCAAAFTVPGGFDSETDRKEDRGSPILISYISFKLFLIFDSIAFFLSLFVCIMWEMSSELTTGDKMLFMTVNSVVVCSSFGFTTYGFIAAVYAMLAHEVDTLSWVVLGSLVTITLLGILAYIRQSVHFVVRRARFHRLCGVSCIFDDIVEKVWCLAERCGLLQIFRSGDEVSRDLITGHAKFCWPLREKRNNTGSSSTRDRVQV